MELGPALVALRGERSCGVETGADQLREELCSTEGQVGDQGLVVSMSGGRLTPVGTVGIDQDP